MAEAAIHLVDELLPLVPVRQFVITFPVQLRLWMARSKSLCAKVCEKVCAELTAHLQHASGIKNGLSGLVVFIQRFGSAANLNIHFHVIALDGVYEKKSTGRLKFYHAQAPSNETIQNLVSNIATKTNNLLIRKKYLEKVEDMVLVGNTEEIFNESGQHSHEDVHLPAQAASVAHRIAFGPNTGQPVRRLKSQTSLWPPEQNFKSTSTACVLAGGYSVSRKGTSFGRMPKPRSRLMNASVLKNSFGIWPDLPSRMNGSSSKGLSPFASNSKALGLMARTHFCLHRANSSNALSL